MLKIGELVKCVPAALRLVDLAAQQLRQFLYFGNDSVFRLIARVELREHAAAVLKLSRDCPWQPLPWIGKIGAIGWGMGHVHVYPEGRHAGWVDLDFTADLLLRRIEGAR